MLVVGRHSTGRRPVLTFTTSNRETMRTYRSTLRPNFFRPAIEFADGGELGNDNAPLTRLCDQPARGMSPQPAPKSAQPSPLTAVQEWPAMPFTAAANNNHRLPPAVPVEAWADPGALPEIEVTPDLPLSKAFQRFRKHMMPRWRQKTRRQAEDACNVMIGVLGDVAVGSLGTATVKVLMGRLAHLPRLRGRSAYTNLPVSECLMRASALRALLERIAQPDLRDVRQVLPTYKPARHKATLAQLAEPISAKTLNRYITFLGQFQAWCRPDSQNNFVAYRADPDHILTAEDTARLPWPDDLLRRLFSSPNWQGWRRYRHLPGPERHLDWMYLAPLLAFLIGLRGEEIAQLQVEDLQYDSRGMPFLAIQVDRGSPTERRRKRIVSPHRSLKSVHALRDIPVPPLVVQAGLIELIQQRTAEGEEWVFPELARGSDLSPDQRLHVLPPGAPCIAQKSPRLTEWFTRYRRYIGVYRPGIDLHSLRKNFYTRLMHAGASEAEANYLMGHAVLKTKHSRRYYGGHDARRLLELLCLVQLPAGVQLRRWL